MQLAFITSDIRLSSSSNKALDPGALKACNPSPFGMKQKDKGWPTIYTGPSAPYRPPPFTLHGIGPVPVLGRTTLCASIELQDLCPSARCDRWGI